MSMFMGTFGDEDGGGGGGVLLPVRAFNILSFSLLISLSLSDDTSLLFVVAVVVVVVVVVWKVVLLGVRFWYTIRSSIDRCWEGSEFERTRFLGFEGIGMSGCTRF